MIEGLDIQGWLKLKVSALVMHFMAGAMQPCSFCATPSWLGLLRRDGFNPKQRRKPLTTLWTIQQHLIGEVMPVSHSMRILIPCGSDYVWWATFLVFSMLQLTCQHNVTLTLSGCDSQLQLHVTNESNAANASYSWLATGGTSAVYGYVTYVTKQDNYCRQFLIGKTQWFWKK